MIAIELRGGRAAAFRFLDALERVLIAVSLGGVESLACHPRTTTASEMSDDDLRVSGVTDGLVRLSVGVEYWRDLAEDLDARARRGGGGVATPRPSRTGTRSSPGGSGPGGGRGWSSAGRVRRS